MDFKKTCSTCKVEKSLTEFFKDSHAKCGFKSACKACCKISKRTYYELNKEHMLETAKEWAKNNLMKSRELKRNYARRQALKKLLTIQ